MSNYVLPVSSLPKYLLDGLQLTPVVTNLRLD